MTSPSEKLASPHAARRPEPTAAAPRAARLPVLALQQLAGNRATASVIQRWWQPVANGKEPNPSSPPNGKKQTEGLRWEEDEKRREPKGAYRFVDSTGQGWEAAGPREPFKKSDWNVLLAAEAKGWYDEKGDRHTGAVPPHYRAASAQERLKLPGPAKTGDAYVPRRYRRKPGKSGPDAERRALDRLARVLIGPMASEESTPHLASLVVGGRLEVAGNTGNRRVTSAEKDEAERVLTKVLDTKEKLPEDRRARKDAMKLRALMSGDYQSFHSGQPGLGAVKSAASGPTVWSNVDTAGSGSEHGELTVLGHLLTNMQLNPGNPVAPTTVNLGGVKLNCLACWFALQVFNTHIAAPLGYHVRSSGTHRGLFPGWTAPAYITALAPARLALRNLLQAERWDLNAHHVAYQTSTDAKDPGARWQDPDESESEWEEEPEVKAPQGSKKKANQEPEEKKSGGGTTGQ